MNRRELLRELSRVQATWVNRNTAGTGDVDITAEGEQDYLARISAVFDRAREDVRRKRKRSAQAMAAQRVIAELMAGFDKDQPRDRKGRWTKGAPGVGAPEAPAAPAGPTAASRTAGLRAGIESGDRSRRPLTGGAMASVELVTFNDGTQAVRKFTRKVPTGRTPKDQNDAEELSAKIADAIGLRTPAIERVSDAQIVMEYVDEADPGTSLPSWRADRLVDTPDGLKMGLLDTLINNPDRHPGNYLVDEDEQGLTAIDHGFAWDDLEDYYPSPFARKVSGRENPFSPEDMAALRPRLEGLRADFERMGHTDWYDQMIELFEHVEKRATGTERILP